MSPGPRMDIEVTVTMNARDDHGQFTGQGFRLSQHAAIPAPTFADAAEILRAYHELTEALKLPPDAPPQMAYPGPQQPQPGPAGLPIETAARAAAGPLP